MARPAGTAVHVSDLCNAFFGAFRLTKDFAWEDLPLVLLVLFVLGKFFPIPATRTQIPEVALLACGIGFAMNRP